MYFISVSMRDTIPRYNQYLKYCFLVILTRDSQVHVYLKDLYRDLDGITTIYKFNVYLVLGVRNERKCISEC